MTATQVLITVIVLIVIAALGYGIWFVTRRRALQTRFGPEYDRAVAEGDSRLAAERELRERERRHAQLEIKELSAESRARYTTQWEEIQARFLDDPAGAVRDADALVSQVAAERGYPTGDHEESIAHLSVEHANTVGHLREAHEISQLSDRGEASTEQLRQAVVHYRTLFSELLGTADVTPSVHGRPSDRDDHAEAAAVAAEADAEHVTGFDDPAERHSAQLHRAAEDDVADVPRQRNGDVSHDTTSRS
ncbi:hypothetical protein [Dactylosporangium matsuzakiense]|uniref:Secreted protein n=1 Tax=Dactylosporangium matsuzakiense TaxID=53360 RepID=A0A9W6NR30_9ACTN|nr:hypothetical protein [Dactylosporangium matsuzakiense]UWZ43134.1 hypothetical protein Dmats_37440 [Dactylosporangium matsuzakiense]GLL06805.1 hypothetical protein GCM10017581_085550 [Dactylosporangium matsuzakiense]